MEYGTISTKGWVVIPAHYRAKYGFKPGTRLKFVDYGGVLAVVAVPKNPIRASRGMLKGKTSLTRALFKEHRRERLHGR